jgi:hypothetical protein
VQQVPTLELLQVLPQLEEEVVEGQQRLREPQQPWA